MAQIIQNINVEVSKPNFFAAIVAKQYDSKSRFLKATLVHEGEKVQIPSTSTVTINAKRNNGSEKSFNGEVNDDGTVTVPLTYWMLEIEGTLKCDISIFDTDESKLTSTDFVVEVEKASCANPDVTDSEKYDVLILQGTNIVGSVNGRTGTVNLTPTDIGAMDYVVEQGESGIWTYRKWNSGVAECWCNTTIEFATNENNPVKMGVNDDKGDPMLLVYTDITLPFNFVTPPSSHCDCDWIYTEWAQSKAGLSAVRVRILGIKKSIDHITTQGALCSIQVKGRWK